MSIDPSSFVSIVVTKKLDKALAYPYNNISSEYLIHYPSHFYLIKFDSYGYIVDEMKYILPTNSFYYRATGNHINISLQDAFNDGWYAVAWNDHLMRYLSSINYIGFIRWVGGRQVFIQEE